MGDGAGPGVVELSVMIAASPATVFRFLSEPERFTKWMGGGATGQPVPGTTIDAKPGGAMVVTYPGGAKAVGEVVEVDEPRRMVFTWGYEDGANGMPPGSCTITMTLKEVTDGTLVTLRHEGISTEEARKGHEIGWRFYLSVLSARGSQAHFGGGVGGVCDAYVAAWNEADAGKRLEALGRSCTEDVVFRDGYGCVGGIEVLSAHIGNAQKHMPGVRLEVVGVPDISHGCLRMGWRMVMPDGNAMMTGVNFVRLSMDGKMREVTGFVDAPPS